MKKTLCTRMAGGLFLGILLLTACSKKDPQVTIDLNPKQLTLQVGQQAQLTLTVDPADSKPEWSVTDPSIASVEGGKVVALSEGETDVVVRVGKESARSHVKVIAAEPKTVSFADANIKALILARNPAIDADKDGEISIQEAQAAHALTLGFETKEDIKPEQRIEQLGGLEHFTSLDSLDLKNQFVTDASPIFRLSKLRQLNIGGNDIERIDLGKMTQLLDLRLYGNARLTQINTEANLLLEQLYLQRTAITHLDLTRLKKLQKAFVNQGQLVDIKFSGLPLLERIDMVKNKLQKIEATDLPMLKELHANNNEITEAQLSNLPELQRLNLYANNLTTIKLSKLPKLMFLFLFENQLKQVDLRELPKLFWLHIGSNPLQEVRLTNNPLIQSIEMTNMPQLELIDLKNGAFSEDAEYEIGSNPKLKKVVVDAGAEYEYVKKILSASPSICIVTD